MAHTISSEQALIYVMVTMSGVEGPINATELKEIGRVVKSLPLGLEGTIDSPLPVEISATVYSQFGMFVLTATLVICLMALVARRRPRIIPGPGRTRVKAA